MNRNKYQRLSKEEKEHLKKLTLDGKSLNQISKITGLGKTTIYYQVKRYKPRLWKKLIANLSEGKIGELIGAFAGDGSYYYSKHKSGGGNHKIRYTLSLSDDMDYAKYLHSLLRQMNLNPFLCYREQENTIEVLVQSKDYLNLIKKYVIWEGKKTYSIKLKNELNSYDEDFLIGFVRGLMDTDGFVESSRVSCGCVSKELIFGLSRIYDKFNIKYKLTEQIRKEPRKNLFLIRVNKESLLDYYNLFGFSNLRKLNSLKNRLKNGVAGI